MSGKRANFRTGLTAFVVCLAASGLTVGFSVVGQVDEDIPRISREDMLALADSIARFPWSPTRSEHLEAACEQNEPYASDWELNEEVVGLPYDWGGMDGPDVFVQKLDDGLAAGSHSRHGSTTCTAGMDCSGYVGYLWGVRDPADKKSTRTLYDIAVRPGYAATGNWFEQLKPGDALNKPGSHVVLFAGYRPDGNPIVYEANGRAGKVIRNDWSTWARYNGYEPLEYAGVVE
jgi:hypothetical protein